MNAGAHTWKACWVQALASSNLASSATSDQAIHKPRSCVRPGLARLHSLICSLIYSTHIGIKRPKVQAHASECYRGCGRPLGVPALSDQLAAVAVTMGERLGSDGARCSTQIAESARLGAMLSRPRSRMQISQFCAQLCRDSRVVTAWRSRGAVDHCRARPVLLAVALGPIRTCRRVASRRWQWRANIVMAPLVAELRHEARFLRERIVTSSTLTERISAQCMPLAPTGTRCRSGGKAAATVVAAEAGTPLMIGRPGSDRHLRRAGTCRLQGQPPLSLDSVPSARPRRRAERLRREHGKYQERACDNGRYACAPRQGTTLRGQLAGDRHRG
jgi:hypothetical protein